MTMMPKACIAGTKKAHSNILNYMYKELPPSASFLNLCIL